ncbi:transducin/WD40 repeat-like superfamily protein, partial [Striga asiatica]
MLNTCLKDFEQVLEYLSHRTSAAHRQAVLHHCQIRTSLPQLLQRQTSRATTDLAKPRSSGSSRTGKREFPLSGPFEYRLRVSSSLRAKILIDNLRNQLTQTNGDQKSSKTLLNLAYEPNTEEYQPVVPDKDSTEQIPITKISLAKFLGLQCTGSLVSDPSNNEKEDMRESVVLSCRVGHSRRNPPSSVSRNCLQLRDPNGCADKTGAEDRADPSTAGRREVADLSHRLWPHNHRYPSGASEIHQCVVSINPSGHSSHCLVALSPSTLSPWLPSLTSAFCRSQPSSPIMEPVNREKNSVKMERVLSCRTSM